MAEAEQTYDDARMRGLLALLRLVAERIRELDAQGRLLTDAPGLLELLGRARSELFHYEVRCTYDTPEIAEHRRLVAEARELRPLDLEPPADDEPWRPSAGD